MIFDEHDDGSISFDDAWLNHTDTHGQRDIFDIDLRYDVAPDPTRLLASRVNVRGSFLRREGKRVTPWTFTGFDPDTRCFVAQRLQSREAP